MVDPSLLMTPHVKMVTGTHSNINYPASRAAMRGRPNKW